MFEFRFTGEQRDPQSSRNFYYLRARYYDPEIGRFLGQDPLPLLNRYTYVRNNPLNFTDPRGLFSHPDIIPDFVDDTIECFGNALDCVREPIGDVLTTAAEKAADLVVGGVLLSSGIAIISVGGICFVAGEGAATASPNAVVAAWVEIHHLTFCTLIVGIGVLIGGCGVLIIVTGECANPFETRSAEASGVHRSAEASSGPKE